MIEVIADLKRVKGLVAENNKLRAILKEIDELAEDELGEWAGVDEAHVPERLQTMKKIYLLVPSPEESAGLNVHS